MSTAADPLALLGRLGVVPVVTIDDADIATPLTRALADGGLAAVEITLRTPAALDAIERAVADVPDALVGAGTVTDAEQARAAIDAGARFLVSPGLADDVIDVAQSQGVTVLPGVATPTELMRAAALDLSAVKLFPAAALGGPSFVRTLSAVWPTMRFVPTGGIDRSTAADYLACETVLAVGGSWMLDRATVAAGRWDEVRSAAADAAALAGGRA